MTTLPAQAATTTNKSPTEKTARDVDLLSGATTSREKSSHNDFCETYSSDGKEITWILPKSLLSPFVTEQSLDVDDLLDRFKTKEDIENTITVHTCKNLEDVPLEEGRCCCKNFPLEDLSIFVYYFNHKMSRHVIGIKIVNSKPEKTQIESIDLLECRTTIPTASYSECGGSVSSPTIGATRQFETELEYTYQLLMKDGAIYDLTVSGLGMIHFEMISATPGHSMVEETETEKSEISTQNFVSW